MEYRQIIYQPGAVTRIVLNRPRYRNAQSTRLINELDDAFRRAGSDPDVRVIVLSGAGESFSAGHDIGTPEELEDRERWMASPSRLDRYVRQRQLYVEASLRWRNRIFARICSAGVKSYTYNWIRALRHFAAPGEIRAFPFLNGLGHFTHERSVLSPLETYPRLAMLYAVNVPGIPMLEWLAARAGIFHVSNQLRRNIPKRPRITATLHDLTCWLMPELHTPANVRADHFFAERTLKRADGCVAEIVFYFTL